MRRSFALFLGGLVLAVPTETFAAGPGVDANVAKLPVNLSAISMFVAFALLTLIVTYWAARRTRSAAQFYTAGGGITAGQNGLAIAGDYMSAASFLGVTGVVYTSGFDGLIYSVGTLVGWPILTFLIAEPLRNLGKYTFADVVSFRFSQTPVRILAATGTLVTVLFYLIAQMVGAGGLIKLLFGMEYWMAVVIVGVLMIVYVTFGGMVATTWVQIIKACLLLVGASFMAFMVLMKYGFDPGRLFQAAVDIHPAKLAIMAPGKLISDPLSAISLGLALMFGAAGLPHILMRFFTVANASAARKSVFYATGVIGYFYILTFIIGFGAITMVATNPEFLDGALLAKGKNAIEAIRGGSNMASMHLAQAIGGELFLGFIAAVAFATILAVVSGLTLAGASAISHDLYATVLKRGRADEDTEVRVSKFATIILGMVAIGLGILFEKQNVAFLVGLIYSIAASCNFPVLILSMYWKGMTTRGAVVGGFVGLVAATLGVVLSPAVWEVTLGFAKGSAPIQLGNPAIISMPLAFATIWLVSKLDSSKRATEDRAGFPAQFFRSQTGIGAARPAEH